MVLLYTLNDNFKMATEGFNTATLWIVRIVLTIIAISILMVLGNVLINGAPARFSY